MNDIKKLEQLLYDYESAGLIEGDSKKVMSFICDDVIGIGIGDQGFISSKKDVEDIMTSTLKKDLSATYELEYENVNIRLTSPCTANICAGITVKQLQNGQTSLSSFTQSLSCILKSNRWYVCSFHASPISLIKESFESYPMTFAQRTQEQSQKDLQRETFELLNQNVSVGMLGAYVNRDDIPPFYVNDSMLSMLGYTKDELMEKLRMDSFAVLHPADKERVRAETIAHTQKVTKYECQYRLICKNGDILWVVEYGKLSIINGQNTILSAFVDITEMMNLQLETKEQNKIILSSITYASKIQKNLLPIKSSFEKAFSDYAIIWKPKDIVGGDIYWAKNFAEGILLCVCDCTGHGVPGALLTMLVVSTFETVMHESNCQDTAQVLWELDQKIANSLNVDRTLSTQTNLSTQILDGCDIAAMFISKEGHVNLSSANINIFTCNGNEVKRLKGQRLHIGEGKLTHKDEVQTISFLADKNDKFYISTDGLFDQIGGEHMRPFGYQLFMDIILQNHTEQQTIISQKIWEAFETHRGKYLRRDDIELVMFTP